MRWNCPRRRVYSTIGSPPGSTAYGGPKTIWRYIFSFTTLVSHFDGFEFQLHQRVTRAAPLASLACRALFARSLLQGPSCAGELDACTAMRSAQDKRVARYPLCPSTCDSLKVSLSLGPSRLPPLPFVPSATRSYCLLTVPALLASGISIVSMLAKLGLVDRESWRRLGFGALALVRVRA
jgi:hypothetical protein